MAGFATEDPFYSGPGVMKPDFGGSNIPTADLGGDFDAVMRNHARAEARARAVKQAKRDAKAARDKFVEEHTFPPLRAYNNRVLDSKHASFDGSDPSKPLSKGLGLQSAYALDTGVMFHNKGEWYFMNKSQWEAFHDDLDLYVKAASGHTVSFNNREGGQGSLISLDHDALGKSRNNSIAQGQQGTVIAYNEEIVSFRGVIEGENIVTVHVYAKTDEKPVMATIKLIKIKPFKEVVLKKREFTYAGEEKIGFRFTTDANGDILDVNELPASLLNPLGE